VYVAVDRRVVPARDVRCSRQNYGILNRRRSRPNRNGFCIEKYRRWLAAESRNRSFAAVLYNYM